MNEVLLIKHLHKFYNKEDVPWVHLVWHIHFATGQIPHASPEKGSFWFRDVMKFASHFRGITSAKVGLEDTVLLWENVWNGHSLANELPRLHLYARNKKISLAQFMSNQDTYLNFHTLISSQAEQKLQQQQIIIAQTQHQQ
jgi:hypothetical protein